MAKKTIKKTEPKLVKLEVVKEIPKKVSVMHVTETPSDATRISNLEARLDRIVAAISKAKSVKGM